MYRYRESGLSNVWLMDGYAWVQTSMIVSRDVV